MLENDHVNSLTELVSADAFVFGAQTGLDVQLRDGLESLAAQEPIAGEELERLGLTGPGGLTSIVGSDVALEVTPGTVFPIDGALMLTTTDPAAMRALMDRWARELDAAIPGGTDWVEAEHAGVSYVSLEPSADLPVPVAYGVVGDVAVIAASPTS